jgi:hypothetical protein
MSWETWEEMKANFGIAKCQDCHVRCKWDPLFRWFRCTEDGCNRLYSYAWVPLQI